MSKELNAEPGFTFIIITKGNDQDLNI